MDNTNAKTPRFCRSANEPLKNLMNFASVIA